jgi:hypothetical protein
MRGRPPKYLTVEEKQEARRQASRVYRAKKNKAFKAALDRIEELEAEVELLRELNEPRSDRDEPIPESSDESSEIEEKLD